MSEKNKENKNEEIIVEKKDDKALKKKKYHSEYEKFYVDQILKINLKEAEKELDERIVIQHKDFATNIDCFNAFAKKVLIKNENGERILINNHDEIKKQKLKNAGKLNKEDNEQIIQVNDDELEFDD